MYKKESVHYELLAMYHTTSIAEMLKCQYLHAAGTCVYTSIHKKIHIGHLTYLTLYSGMYGFTIQQSIHIFCASWRRFLLYAIMTHLIYNHTQL